MEQHAIPSPRVGRVVGVCLRPTSGVPKYRQEAIVIGPDGVVGYYHAGPVNRHRKKGPPEPNHRQLTLVAQEVLDELNALLGTTLHAGSLGENITVEGLGDLSDLAPGTLLRVGSAILEVTGQNQPCKTIAVYHPHLVKLINGRRGVTAIVRQPGIARPNDQVMVLGPLPESQTGDATA